MSRFLEKELNSEIKKYLKIRKVLRIVEVVLVIVVVLTAVLVKPKISDAVFSLLAAFLIPECFIAIQRWGVNCLIKGVKNILECDLEKHSKLSIENQEKLISHEFYKSMCKILEKELEELEDMKRLVIF